MRRELKSLINERIVRSREKIIGHAISDPYLSARGDSSPWVIDVVVRSDREILYAVPIAESGRKVRAFISVGAPIELQRNALGQFFAVALADRQRGNTVKNAYSRSVLGFGFVSGWKYSSTGTIVTGNNNTANQGNTGTTTNSYTRTLLTYGELSYGTTPYGAYKITRT